MAKVRRVIRKQDLDIHLRFDEKLWPVNLALALLGGFLMGIVLAKLRFDDPRWWHSAWFHLLTVAASVGAGIYGATYLKGSYLKRGMQLAMIISMALHGMLLLTLMAIYIPENSKSPPKNAKSGLASRAPLIVAEQPVKKIQTPIFERKIEKTVDRKPEEATHEEVRQTDTEPPKSKPDPKPLEVFQERVEIPTPAPQRKTDPAESAPRRSEAQSALSRQTEKSLPVMSAQPATAAQATAVAQKQVRPEAQASQIQRESSAASGLPKSAAPELTAPQEIVKAQFSRRSEQVAPTAQTTAQAALPRQVAQPSTLPRTEVQTTAAPSVSKQTRPEALAPGNLTAQKASSSSPATERRPAEAPTEITVKVAQAVETRQQPTEVSPALASSLTQAPNRRVPTEVAPSATQVAATTASRGPSPATEPSPMAAAPTTTIARVNSAHSARSAPAVEAPSTPTKPATNSVAARAASPASNAPSVAAAVNNTATRATSNAAPNATANAAATAVAPSATPGEAATPGAVVASVSRATPNAASAANPSAANPIAPSAVAATALASGAPTRLPNAAASPTVATSKGGAASRQTSANIAAANTLASTTNVPQSTSPNANTSGNPAPATSAVARAESASPPTSAPSGTSIQAPATSETRSPSAQLARAEVSANANAPTVASLASTSGTPARSIQTSEVPTSPTQAERPSVSVAGAVGNKPTSEPARMAFERSVGGIAGKGAGPNMDRSGPALDGQAPVASAAAERAQATQTSPTGPELSPSAPAPGGQGRAISQVAHSSTLAQLTPLAEVAGSRSPGEAASSASAAVERASSNAPTGTVSAAAGTLEIDTGTTQIVAEGGTSRASGGGQPILSPDAQSMTIARRSTNSAPAASLNTAAMAEVVAAPTGETGPRATAPESVATASGAVKTEAGGSLPVTGGPAPAVAAGPQGGNPTADKVDAAVVARASGAEKAPSDDEEKEGGGDPSVSAGALARSASGGAVATGSTATLVAAAGPVGGGAPAAAGSLAAANTAAGRAAATEAGVTSGEKTTDVPAATANAAELVGKVEAGRAVTVEANAGAPAAGGGTATAQRAASGPPLVMAVTAPTVQLANQGESSGVKEGIPIAAQGTTVARETGGAVGAPNNQQAGAAANEVAVDVPSSGAPGPAAGTRVATSGATDAPLAASDAKTGAPLSRAGAAAAPLGTPSVALANAPAAAKGAEGSQPTEAMTAAGTMEVGPASRQTTGAVPVDVVAPDGVGGLGEAYALDTGLSSRLSQRESQEVHLREARFKRSEASGGPASTTNVAVSKEGFEGRGKRKGSTQDAAGGESTRTEAAVEMGLVFLSRHQSTDGSWSLHNFGAGRPGYDAETCAMQSDTAATGLCLLTFLGAGYHHQEDKYRNQIHAGITYLVSHQQPNGDLYVPMDKLSNASSALYSHAIAAMALCEAYAMTQDPELKVPAQKAIDFIAASQDPKRGGWRYLQGQESDTSVTGWMMMAVKSGALAGLKVAPEVNEGINKWLDKAQVSPTEGHQYRYNPNAPDTVAQREGRKASKSMTAVALLMRYYSGWGKDHEQMIKGADYLLTQLPSETERDTYYWYYATYVMCNMEGKYWETWSQRMTPLLRETQVKEGPLAGSWNPRLPSSDRWAIAGRLYVTTFNLLNLEVQHRRLPLYDKTVVEQKGAKPK